MHLTGLCILIFKQHALAISHQAFLGKLGQGRFSSSALCSLSLSTGLFSIRYKEELWPHWKYRRRCVM